MSGGSGEAGSSGGIGGVTVSGSSLAMAQDNRTDRSAVP
jgi:hypothetical protein